ncbi:hypothetical protein S101468_00740 [Acetobacter pasteurianus subsp. pasteurianus]|uniref:Uncharacterized protein n=1 Tax=Acetobacter pasteurianus subsp. pasteurianus TaxID=481145 RepID=A0AAC9SPC5_ACEPA|nr:hypothetical protein S101468_00740 [Acetobacter pasteurianus subsp. pasteurianus]
MSCHRSATPSVSSGISSSKETPSTCDTARSIRAGISAFLLIHRDMVGSLTPIWDAS